MTKEEYKTALEALRFYKNSINASKRENAKLMKDLHNMYEAQQTYESLLRTTNHNILEYETRLGIEHPEMCICKNCKYFHELKELVNKEWFIKSCCTLLPEKEEDRFKAYVIVCREDDGCGEFKLRAGVVND